MNKHLVIIATIAIAVSIGYATTLKVFKTADNQNNLAQTKQSSRNTSSTSCPDCSALEKEYEVALKEYFVVIDEVFADSFEYGSIPKYFEIDADEIKKLEQVMKKHDIILEKLKKCWRKRDAYCTGFISGIGTPTPSTPSTPSTTSATSTCPDCTLHYKKLIETITSLNSYIKYRVFYPAHNNKPINMDDRSMIVLLKKQYITHKEEWEECLELRRLFCEGFKKAKLLERGEGVKTKN
jgi:hypothetical protein